MGDQFSLPHRVTLLGEAMRPLGRKISAELDMPVAPVADVYGINEIVSNHLAALQDIVQRVPDRLASRQPVSNALINRQSIAFTIRLVWANRVRPQVSLATAANSTEYCMINSASFVATTMTWHSEVPTADHRRRCPQDSQNMSPAFTDTPHFGQNDIAPSVAGAASAIGMVGGGGVLGVVCLARS